MPNIRFNCPKCSQSISAPAQIIGTEAECPTCNRKFYVAPFKSELGWEYEPEETKVLRTKRHMDSEQIENERQEIVKESAKLHDEAESTRTKGAALLGFWILASIIAAFFMSPGRDYPGALCCRAIAAICFLTAMYMFLAAHLLHIRAAIVRLGTKE